MSGHYDSCETCGTEATEGLVCTTTPCQCSCHALGAGCYHVWCLTWEDDEEVGCGVVGYDPISEGWKDTTGRTIFVPFRSASTLDAGEAAETYADYCHGNRDGWEATWPLTFRVRKPDGTTDDFEVERDVVPEFTACPVRKVAR